MANFNMAYEITRKHEGGYNNDPRDAGGETYKGISRNFNPQWRGWPIIDAAKKSGRAFPDCLELDEYSDLQIFVRDLFKDKYWDVFWGDGMGPQIIANELFDTGVNMGTQRAILFLQRSINILKMHKHIITTETLVEDGIFGTKTFTALDTMDERYTKALYNLMNVMQGNHYIEYVMKDRRQSKYMMGWLKRVDMVKK